MINIKDEQFNHLSNYIKNLKELIDKDDINELLIAIDDVIVENIVNNNDEPDDEGIKLQRIYDQIYNQN